MSRLGDVYQSILVDECSAEGRDFGNQIVSDCLPVGDRRNSFVSDSLKKQVSIMYTTGAKMSDSQGSKPPDIKFAKPCYL